VTSKLILRSADGNVLLVKPTFRDTWQLPGGSVENHETPIETAIREVSEEVGIDIDPQHVSIVGTVPRDNYTIMVYEYALPVAEDIRYDLHETELSDYKFEHPDKVPSLLGSYYGKFWEAYRA
jgi:8-oxo-dGTP pyrophosphatase MutT (NUDIX family)